MGLTILLLAFLAFASLMLGLKGSGAIRMVNWVFALVLLVGALWLVTLYAPTL